MITTGNHVWRHRDLIPVLESSERVLRPANLGGSSTPGRGTTVVAGARRDAGRGDQPDGLAVHDESCPPLPGRRTSSLTRRAGDTPVVIVDFHAEATSEKMALARLLDGRVTAVIGTHTHVQTNDARVLAGRNGRDHRRRHDRAARLGDRRARRAGDRAHARPACPSASTRPRATSGSRARWSSAMPRRAALLAARRCG